jgi:hypothetical protein
MLVSVQQYDENFLEIKQKEKRVALVTRIILAKVIFFPNQKRLSGRLYRARWLRAIESQLELGPDDCLPYTPIEYDGRCWVDENGEDMDYASFVDWDLRELAIDPVLAIRRPEESFMFAAHYLEGN